MYNILPLFLGVHSSSVARADDGEDDQEPEHHREVGERPVTSLFNLRVAREIFWALFSPPKAQVR